MTLEINILNFFKKLLTCIIFKYILIKIKAMALAIAEPFNYPVDLAQYPDYMLEIEYPMDFSLIKSRLDNQVISLSLKILI